MTVLTTVNSLSAHKGGAWASTMIVPVGSGEQTRRDLDLCPHYVLLLSEDRAQDVLRTLDVFGSIRSSLTGAIASRLALPGVAALYGTFEEGNLRVWVVTDVRDPVLRSQVHMREREILARFPELMFDFAIISREHRPLSAVAPREATLIWTRDARPGGPHRAG